MADGHDDEHMRFGREVVELDRAEALRLLASVTYGRVVFSLHTLPAIRAVNHLVDDEDGIIVRTRLTAKISTAVSSNANSGLVVAYQAEDLDPLQRLGWSVVVTGLARTVTDPDQIARYEQLLHPWVNEADTAVAIEPQVGTGIRIMRVDGTLTHQSSRRTARDPRSKDPLP
jgi:hypothetical protein